MTSADARAARTHRLAASLAAAHEVTVSRLIRSALAVVLLTATGSPGRAEQAVAAAPPAPSQPPGAVRFAVIGDNGTGKQPQFDIGAQMVNHRATFPYDMVLMVGDNLYVRATTRGYEDAFARPYRRLLDAGVRFFAVLGNHDDPDSVDYAGFNMGGQRYYTFTRGDVRFFALDTNRLDPAQLAWFDAALAASTERWKIVVFHHPLYSDGVRHGSNVELRVRLEPLLVRHGVNVVLSGHDHHYQRFKPQKGVVYFVAGSGGQLRTGMRASAQSAAAFDAEQTFMLAAIAGDELTFRAISRSGRLVDSGVVARTLTR
jgi:3',5'-cyclic AMP phosphodiesterase CpdA